MRAWWGDASFPWENEVTGEDGEWLSVGGDVTGDVGLWLRDGLSLFLSLFLSLSLSLSVCLSLPHSLTPSLPLTPSFFPLPPCLSP